MFDNFGILKDLAVEPCETIYGFFWSIATVDNCKLCRQLEDSNWSDVLILP